MRPSILVGEAPLTLPEVECVIVPARGRSDAGKRLSLLSLDRVDFTMELLHSGTLPAVMSVLCSGGWSPGEVQNLRDLPRRYAPIDRVNTEAALMRQAFIDGGLPAGILSMEDESIDSVTNLVFVEHLGYLPDGAPVAIVAQKEHLSRFIHIIAPRVLRRPFLGILVPERRSRDSDSLGARLATRWILRGFHPDSPHLVDLAYTPGCSRMARRHVPESGEEICDRIGWSTLMSHCSEPFPVAAGPGR